MFPALEKSRELFTFDPKQHWRGVGGSDNRPRSLFAVWCKKWVSWFFVCLFADNVSHNHRATDDLDVASVTTWH